MDAPKNQPMPAAADAPEPRATWRAVPAWDRSAVLQRLAQHLRALALRVTGEVGDVERERCPESDHARQRRKEERPELSGLGLAGIKRGRLREHRAESPRLPVRPGKKGDPEEDQEWRLDVEEEADRFDPLVDHEHVDSPEEHEAAELGDVDAGDPDTREVEVKKGKGRPKKKEVSL